jgi:hypothetical protein
VYGQEFSQSDFHHVRVASRAKNLIQYFALRMPGICCPRIAWLTSLAQAGASGMSVAPWRGHSQRSGSVIPWVIRRCASSASMTVGKMGWDFLPSALRRQIALAVGCGYKNYREQLAKRGAVGRERQRQ